MSLTSRPLDPAAGGFGTGRVRLGAVAVVGPSAVVFVFVDGRHIVAWAEVVAGLLEEDVRLEEAKDTKHGQLAGLSDEGGPVYAGAGEGGEGGKEERGSYSPPKSYSPTVAPPSASPTSRTALPAMP